MGGIDYYKPIMAMVAMQLSYAVVALSTRAALLQGMIPSVFVFYRQGMATLVIAPIAYFTRRERSCLELRSFCLIFSASLVGIATPLHILPVQGKANRRIRMGQQQPEKYHVEEFIHPRLKQAIATSLLRSLSIQNRMNCQTVCWA